MPESIPQKQCRTCKQCKPATTEFFNATAAYQSSDGLNKQCKECRKAYRKTYQKKPKSTTQEGYKRCTLCIQEYPATPDYFYADKTNKDGLGYQCKQCIAKHRAMLSKQREPVCFVLLKQCSKCNRSLPATTEYFGINRYLSDGLHSSCRQCKNTAQRNAYVKKTPLSLPAGYKRCSVCGELKRATTKNFQANKSGQYGLRSACKPCQKAQRLRHAYLNKMPSVKSKRCPTCLQLKPATTEFFSAARGRYDGIGARCKHCVNRIYNTAHRKVTEPNDGFPTHKQCRKCKQVKPLTIDYYHRKPDTRDGFKHQCKDCCHLARTWNRGEERVYEQWYRTTHKEQQRAKSHKRRTLKINAGGSFTAQDIYQQHVRQKRKCYYCRQQMNKYHIEHVIPLSRGGSNDMSNIVLACPQCNLRKGNKLPHEWFTGGRLL